VTQWQIDRFDTISPLDSRYAKYQEIRDYLSERARIRHQLLVEAALAKELAAFNICSFSVAGEIEAACHKVTAEDVYDGEDQIGHDIRALANEIRKRVSEEARPFVHLGATSYDIVNTADALRFVRFVRSFLIPAIDRLISTIGELAHAHSDTVQIGRTHGQHAVPITFGFAVAGYYDRLREARTRVNQRCSELPGKFSGAVGGYHLLKMILGNVDPRQFEASLLRGLDLNACRHSTQIVQPEPLLRLMFEVSLVGGIIADMAESLRNLQRTEINEVREGRSKKQVGSSTMPQKRNPIGSENLASIGRVNIGKLMTALLNQTSEHQRDLRDSASSRTYGELFAYVHVQVKRMIVVISGLEVFPEQMKKNLAMTGDEVVAEALYGGLARIGHPDAHNKTMEMVELARASGLSLWNVVTLDQTLSQYGGIPKDVLRVLADPSSYIGACHQIAEDISDNTRRK